LVTTARSLLVVGSANADLVARTPRLPAAGETVLGRDFTVGNGGKGANQAVAAARLGLRVRLAAAVGKDAYGDQLLAALAAEHVDVSAVQRSTAPTGVALIVVDDQGENTIVVAPGANATLGLDDVDLQEPDAVLCQLEIPLEVVEEAARLARGLFCLNASPMADLPTALIDRCDLVVVNESEYDAAPPALRRSRLLALTLGPDGAVLLRRGTEVARSASPAVDDVDSTGAGDAFAAALVHGLVTEVPAEAALQRACRAGALAVSRLGAQSSLPYLEELHDD
jgi:ribokinase